MSDTTEPLDEEDYGVRWWDDYEITGKTPESRAKQVAALEDRLKRLYDYCADDVRAERAADKHLFPLSDSERQVYLLDQKINDRGVAVDLPTVKACINLLDKAAKKLDKEIAILTGGQVTALTQRDRLVNWLSSQGATFTSLSKQNVSEALKTDLPHKVKRALELRQIGAKSSVKKLQAIMRMVDLETGRIQGNLLYHGASTGRFAGKGVQLQNLTRPELLKEPEDAIPYLLMEDDELIDMAFGPAHVVVADVMRSLFCAGPGKILYAADFAQIEARVLAWVAGQDDLVDQFRDDADIYSNFASKVYNKSINKKDHPTERQLGKTCIAEGTLVYTDQGLVEIQNVTKGMRVWDGVEWVNHTGLLFQGMKQTLNVSGIWLTPDHQVLCEKTWLPADWVRRGNTLALALETGQAAYASLVSKLESKEGFYQSSYVASVLPRMNIRLDSQISQTEIQMDAKDASGIPSAHLTQEDLFTQPCVQTARSAKTYSGESITRYRDATTRNRRNTKTTVSAAYESIQGGLKTDPNIFRISSLFRVGIIPNFKLTESTLTEITNQETSDSYQDQKTCEIVGQSAPFKIQSKNCEKKSPVLKRVYDIANAGPRTRFMVWTPQGPLVVHNCILGLGFAMGAAKFVLSCEKGGIQIDEKESKRVVGIYRSTYSAIPKFWYNFEKAIIRAVRNPALTVTFRMFKMRMRDGHLRLQLPSGRVLNYPFAKVVQAPTPWGETRQAIEISAVDSFSRKWTRTVVTPGTWTENVVQAIARDVMVEGMFRLEDRGFEVILTIHDEVICEAAEGHGTEKQFEALLEQVPKWAEGLPIKAEAYISKRYRK